MHAAVSVLVTLALSASAASAQQPSRPDNPPAQTTPPASDQAAPSPDVNGVYRAVPGIESPYLTSPAMATLPADADTSRPRIVRFTAVIGADGSVGKLSLLNPQGDALETAAAAAIQQSKFAPGTLNGNPVPVQVCVSVPFLRLRPPIPHLQPCIDPNGPSRSHLPPGTTPPHAIHFSNPEYSDEARKKKIQGVVLLSTLVNEQGEPTDIRIEKSLGYGLDENAMRAVSQYRFEPARDRDGKPVAIRIRIEVNFWLY